MVAKFKRQGRRASFLTDQFGLSPAIRPRAPPNLRKTSQPALRRTQVDGAGEVGRAAEAPAAGRRANYAARAISMDSRSPLTTIISREASFDEDRFEEEQTNETATSNAKGEDFMFHKSCEECKNYFSDCT